jgi:transposase-like protein
MWDRKRFEDWDIVNRRAMKMVYEDVVCKFCGSRRVRSYGSYKRIPRWWCKDCKRKFVDNDALPRMRTPVVQIATALGNFYEGMSLNGIRRSLQQTYQNYPSDSTVYGWIVRFTDIAIKEANKYHPKVGDIFVADETVLRVGGKKYWLLDIIDTTTRFLLATKLSHNRNKNDIRTLMELARYKAQKTPKEVVTDGWGGYLDGIELAYGADAKHIRATPFGSIIDSTVLIERWHGSLKDRTKVMRSLKSKETGQRILDGWLFFYNFFRPHEALRTRYRNLTPAEKAEIRFPFKSWLDIVKGG